jgi:hypothetical protein
MKLVSYDELSNKMTLRSDWPEAAVDESKVALRGSPIGSPRVISAATLRNRRL